MMMLVLVSSLTFQITLGHKIYICPVLHICWKFLVGLFFFCTCAKWRAGGYYDEWKGSIPLLKLLNQLKYDVVVDDDDDGDDGWVCVECAFSREGSLLMCWI